MSRQHVSPTVESHCYQTIGIVNACPRILNKSLKASLSTFFKSGPELSISNVRILSNNRLHQNNNRLHQNEFIHESVVAVGAYLFLSCLIAQFHIY